MRKVFLLLALVCASASGAWAQGFTFQSNIVNGQGTPVAGANVAVCYQMTTTAASVSDNLATLTMASDPVTAGYTPGGTLFVSGFTGADTYFNGTFQVLAVSATTITYDLVHANDSASTNGLILEEGVNVPCGALASIYTDYTLNTSTPNPVITDGLGNFGFSANPGQFYLQKYGQTIDTTIQNITLPCVLRSQCGGVLPGTPVFYVGPSGSDLTGDGLSPGSAFATVYHALCSLPGGDCATQTAGGGTVYILSGAAANPISTDGVWIMGSQDPNYSSPPAGWLRQSSFEGITLVGIGQNNLGDNGHQNMANLVGGAGNSADTTHPLFWFANANGITINNIAGNYQARFMNIGINSNGDFNDDASSSGITLDGVFWNGAQPGSGPGIVSALIRARPH